jgi:putative PIN family toxin of toxin-antitoxin system
MKVVIDTNVLLRSISKHNAERSIYKAFDGKKFTWVFSNEILLEYAEIIGDRYSDKTADLILTILLKSNNHQKFEPSYKWQLVTDDPDDNKFVDCALGANVDYLVTDDKHMINLLKIPNLFPPIPIVSFKEFSKILENLKL